MLERNGDQKEETTVEKDRGCISQQSPVSSRHDIVKKLIELVKLRPDGITVDNLASCYGLRYPDSGVGRGQANQVLRILQKASKEIAVERAENGVWFVKMNRPSPLRDEGKSKVIGLEEEKEDRDSPSSPSVPPEPKSSPAMTTSTEEQRKNNRTALQTLIERIKAQNGTKCEDVPKEDTVDTPIPINQHLEQLYETVHKILAVNTNGIRLKYLPTVYEGCIGKDLNIDEAGFENLRSFLESRPDLFEIKNAALPDDVFVYAGKKN